MAKQGTPIRVYVRINERDEIIEVGSSIFIADTTAWQRIDEGYGDKYAHAQSQYFSKPLMNESGKYNYKYNQLTGRVEESENV